MGLGRTFNEVLELVGVLIDAAAGVMVTRRRQRRFLLRITGTAIKS